MSTFGDMHLEDPETVTGAVASLGADSITKPAFEYDGESSGSHVESSLTGSIPRTIGA